jgi:hypothetical protein
MTRATGVRLKAICEIIPRLSLATVFVLNVLKNIIPIIIFMTNDLIARYGMENNPGSGVKGLNCDYKFKIKIYLLLFRYANLKCAALIIAN